MQKHQMPWCPPSEPNRALFVCVTDTASCHTWQKVIEFEGLGGCLLLPCMQKPVYRKTQVKGLHVFSEKKHAGAKLYSISNWLFNVCLLLSYCACFRTELTEMFVKGKKIIPWSRLCQMCYCVGNNIVQVSECSCDFTELTACDVCRVYLHLEHIEQATDHNRSIKTHVGMQRKHTYLELFTCNHLTHLKYN